MASSPPARPTRTLLVMRHAEAGPGGPDVPDAARPLTPAGRLAAEGRGPVVRDHLGAGGRVVVLCSSALRTRQTLAGLGVAAAGDVQVEVGDALYEASATSLLLRLAALDADVRTCLVIGHMPTVAAVVAGLTGRRDAPPFPPAALSVLALGAPWPQLRPGAGQLLAHHV